MFEQRTEVRFSSFFSGGFITAIVVNPPERKLAKRTSVQCMHYNLELCVVKNGWFVNLFVGMQDGYISLEALINYLFLHTH